MPVVAGEAPIGFHPTAAQVQDPEAEFVMRSTGLSFKVFTILMPRTRNFIPQRTSKRRMLILSNTRLIVCHALFCVGVFFFPETFECYDCHLCTPCGVGRVRHRVPGPYESDTDRGGLILNPAEF